MESPLTRSVPGCSVGLCWLCFTLSRLGCQYFQWWLGCLHLPMAHLNQLARWGCLVRDITSWTSEGLRSLSQGLKHKGWLDVLMIEAEMAQGTNSSCLSTDKIRFSANGEKTDVSPWADSGDSPLHLPGQTREQRPLHCWMALEGPERVVLSARRASWCPSQHTCVAQHLAGTVTLPLPPPCMPWSWACFEVLLPQVIRQGCLSSGEEDGPLQGRWMTRHELWKELQFPLSVQQGWWGFCISEGSSWRSCWGALQTGNIPVIRSLSTSTFLRSTLLAFFFCY